jgi:uncharacterized protein YjbJ (UPF0337 family)
MAGRSKVDLLAMKNLANLNKRFISKERVMGRDDITAGRIKQIKGKANDIAGAVTGNTSRQAKGKLQQAVGKVQVAIGKATAKQRASRS